MKMLFARTEYGRPYFLPPDVPADRVETLRRAFDATMKDPEFLAEAEKSQTDISPMTGEEAQKIAESTIATPPDVLARANALIEGK
jgi:tripartite-type tricarboxylate transporter receptor subunit TctC